MKNNPTNVSFLLQSSPDISNSEGTGQKVRDSAILEIALLRDRKITPGENSRWRDFEDLLTSNRIGPIKTRISRESL